MVIFGIKLNKPNTRELVLAGAVILSMALALFVMSYFKLGVLSSFPMLFTAIVVGILSALYGINPTKGVRHVIALLVISAVVYLLLYSFVV